MKWLRPASKSPTFVSSPDLPYVLKSPSAYRSIEQTLATREIEAAIIPVRDLVDAATSRVVVELHNIHHRTPLMSEIDRTWEDWGYTRAA